MLMRDWSKSSFVVFGSAIVGAAGLFVGLIGLWIAVRGDRLAHSLAHEQRSVQLEAHPTVNQRDFTEEGLGLRVTLINEGLRPVIIRKASFWMARCKVGDAVGWINDVRVFDRHQIDPGAIIDQKLDLPVTVNSREGKVIALLVDYWTPCRSGEQLSEDAVRKTRRAERRLRDAVAGFPLDERHPVKFSLMLDRVPGGRVRVPVAVQPGMTPRFDWQVMFDLDGPTVTGLSIRRKLGAQGQADVLRLNVWGQFSDFHATVTRPIVGAEFTHFPLVELPPGRYFYAFLLEGKAVSANRFRQPAPCKTPYGFAQPPC